MAEPVSSVPLAPTRSPDTFVVRPPRWAGDRTLELHYAHRDDTFVERIEFGFDVAAHVPAGAPLLDLLAAVAGVSYFKLDLPLRFALDGVALTPAGAEAVRHVYDDGLRECAVRNQLPVPLAVDFHLAETPAPTSGSGTPADAGSPRVVLPFGAGRDSTVTAAALAPLAPQLLTVGRNRHAEATAAALGLPIAWAERHLDVGMLARNAAGTGFNGHVPVTAINSLVACVVAGATGATDVVMANEASASAPTRVIDGVPVNHQYSKSAEFERLLAAAVSETWPGLRYYSVLRPYADHQISRALSRLDAPVRHRFVSCNRAFVRDPAKRPERWCTRCAKCAAVYLALAPWFDPAELESMFGADLLADAGREFLFRELLVDDDKPYECVADVLVARADLARLVHDPRWSGHAVVAALAPLAADVAPAPRAEHHDPAPAAVRRLLDAALAS